MNRVLLVDDEPSITRSIARLLRRSGFEIETVNDPESALQLLSTRSFSVIVSDQRMPQGSGVELLEVCSREYPSMTRILLTGYTDAEAAAEAVNRAEIFRLLWKPWNDDELISIVRQAAWKHELMSGPADEPEPAPEPPPMLRLVGGAES